LRALQTFDVVSMFLFGIRESIFSIREFLISNLFCMLLSWLLQFVPLEDRVNDMTRFFSECQRMLWSDIELRPASARQVAMIMYRLRNTPDIQQDYFRIIIDTVFPSNLVRPYAFTSEQLARLARFVQSLMHVTIFEDEPAPRAVPCVSIPKDGSVPRKRSRDVFESVQVTTELDSDLQTAIYRSLTEF